MEVAWPALAVFCRVNKGRLIEEGLVTQWVSTRKYYATQSVSDWIAWLVGDSENSPTVVSPSGYPLPESPDCVLNFTL